MSFQSHQPLGKPDNLLILNPTDIQTPDIRFHLYQSNWHTPIAIILLFGHLLFC